MQLTLAEAAQVLHCPPPANAGRVEGYSIDSRTVRPGDLFFALPGERVDGHDFVLSALGTGAAGAVVARRAFDRFAPNFRGRLLPVEDPVAALQALAQAVRRRWGKPIIGITGSSGKTSTKEMIARVLSVRYRVLKSEGNLNNHLGLPLSLLRLSPVHDLAVLEMGMNHVGEIARLAELAQPQVGVFTNVGPVHLGHFASLEAIAEAKRELALALPAHGVMVLNADDPLVSRFSAGFAGSVLRYGLEGHGEGAENGEAPRRLDLVIRGIRLLGLDGSEFTAQAFDGGVAGASARVRLPLLARHSISNAAAALAAGVVFGIPLEPAALALAGTAPPAGRGRVLHRGGATIIDDCYNSNPPALESMVNLLAGLPGARRILIAGEMRELGPAATAWHRRIGELVAQRRIEVLWAVGGEAREILAAAQAAGFEGQGEFFAAAEDCGPRLAALLQPGDVVLAKASRGVHLERALAAILGPDSAAPTATAGLSLGS
ncbi:MAG: UDP-N-acetylmuramoyl-tripeptide--D-alanyl-D-alanine ligase [Terriglobales bacterium]